MLSPPKPLLFVFCFGSRRVRKLQYEFKLFIIWLLFIAHDKTIMVKQSLVFTDSQCRIKIDAKHMSFYVCPAFSDESVSVDGKFEDRKQLAQMPRAFSSSFFCCIFSLPFKHTRVSSHYWSFQLTISKSCSNARAIDDVKRRMQLIYSYTVSLQNSKPSRVYPINCYLENLGICWEKVHSFRLFIKKCLHLFSWSTINFKGALPVRYGPKKGPGAFNGLRALD